MIPGYEEKYSIVIGCCGFAARMQQAYPQSLILCDAERHRTFHNLSGHLSWEGFLLCIFKCKCDRITLS